MTQEEWDAIPVGALFMVGEGKYLYQKDREDHWTSVRSVRHNGGTFGFLQTFEQGQLLQVWEQRPGRRDRIIAALAARLEAAWTHPTRPDGETDPAELVRRVIESVT